MFKDSQNYETHGKYKKILHSLNLGFFLAFKQIRGSSVGATVLIIFVMTLTFLNLIVIRGIFIGLIEGAITANRVIYTGDIFISSPPKKEYIENSQQVIETIETLPSIASYSARYVESGRLEGTYKERLSLTDKPNESFAVIAGVDPERENRTTGLASKIVAGSYLTKDDTDSIIVGANLLKKYLPVESPGILTLEDVWVGSKVRLTVGGNTKEVTVKGVIKTKVGELDQRIYMLDSTMRTMIGRTDYNVDEIAVALKKDSDAVSIQNMLVASGIGENTKIQTSVEAMPRILKDVKDTFDLLGTIVGSIGLVAASITIFIVIYINAITRRKFIGILKGIGISSLAIEYSYVLQSIFYATSGAILGTFILYLFLIPYMAVNPIDFPFGDGILVADIGSTALRAGLLLITTIVAGYIPARYVAKQNTLDSILGK